jgi:hypothetical protein
MGKCLYCDNPSTTITAKCKRCGLVTCEFCFSSYNNTSLNNNSATNNAHVCKTCVKKGTAACTPQSCTADESRRMAGAADTAAFAATPSNCSLAVDIVGARELPPVDHGTSSPFCVLFFEGREYATDVAPHMLAPRFANASFDIAVQGTESGFHVCVYHAREGGKNGALLPLQRKTNDPLLGSVFIPLAAIPCDGVMDEWLPLANVRANKAAGQRAVKATPASPGVVAQPAYYDNGAVPELRVRACLSDAFPNIFVLRSRGALVYE